MQFAWLRRVEGLREKNAFCDVVQKSAAGKQNLPAGTEFARTPAETTSCVKFGIQRPTYWFAMTICSFIRRSGSISLHNNVYIKMVIIYKNG